MAINVDTTQSLRRPGDLLALVDAVRSAHPSDESWWIEWKSDLKLRSPDGAFKAARAILSFANRMPEVAATACDGLAYLLVGVEPGLVHGTEAIDPADLEGALIKYLGADGPVWSPNYVTVDGKTVLVVIVEPPQWGDPIHTLRKTFEKSAEGTIFVRSQAISRPANASEIRMLSDRLLRGVGVPELTGLDVSCRVTPPEGLLVIDPSPGDIETWITKRQEAVLSGQRGTDSDGAKFINMQVYDAKALDQYLEKCRERLFDAQRLTLIAWKYSIVELSVTSPGPLILEDVELTLRLDVPWSAFETGEAPEDLKGLPEVPKPRSRLTMDALGLGPIRPFAFKSPRIPNPNLEIDESSITLSLGRIRPEKRSPATPFHLFLHHLPDESNKVTLEWTLTSTSTAGIQRGSLEVPVHSARGVFMRPELSEDNRR
ncbi:helix-turn-helix domain-containing protein [Kribbella sp. NPDC051586]|uniref:helix-turn-helix domain-containing protein n=1 Tax=Kribbella sp. NPDC051586 TaxID=3364118 RepID=UPI0037BC33D8